MKYHLLSATGVLLGLFNLTLWYLIGSPLTRGISLGAAILCFVAAVVNYRLENSTARLNKEMEIIEGQRKKLMDEIFRTAKHQH